MKKLLAFLLFTIPIASGNCSLSAQTISTVAGNHAFGAGYSGDGGTATSAELSAPLGVAFDGSGNMYIADGNNNVIRKVNTSGTVSTVAGNNAFGLGYSGDGGPATSAEMHLPWGVAFDGSGNMYIADGGNNVIRQVNTSGNINTVAGDTAFGLGYSGDGGPATSAGLFNPIGVAFDGSGNMYIADLGNDVIRQVNTSGNISTVAGNYAFGTGFSGDGGPATSAELFSPGGVAFDGSGNMYIEDHLNNLIRQVNTSGTISTVAGNGGIAGFSGDGGPATSAQLNYPSGVAVDGSNNMYIIDGGNNVIRQVNSSGTISTVAGNHALGGGFSGDGGPATSAKLNSPWGVAFDGSGNMYIADANNNVIRKVSPLTGIEQLSVGAQWAVYPNPSTGIFTFQSSVVSDQWSVEVYNVLGEKVYSKSYQLKTIDLRNQPNGVYFFRVLGEDGGVIGEGKLVMDR